MIFRPYHYFDTGFAAYLFGCGMLHTPGHTAESISLVVSDLRRGPEPWFVLSGDTLFIGAVGRPDLPGQRRNASELYAA
jgi:hydroxyacylglutathione hydrolase